MTDRRQDQEIEPRVETPAEVERAPGFPTGAALQRRIQRRALQRRADGGRLDETSGVDGDQVQAAAALGTRGAAGPLPHGDSIQRAFGRHDVSGIAAHVDADAAAGARAMGAEAFASGGEVAFDGAPSLHTAAHEAAHVVQQRGGVQLAGGVGAEGDPYERHADAVADRVVAGGSAEALLDEHAGGGGAAGPVGGDAAGPVGDAAGAGAVQRKITVTRDQLEYADHQVAFRALRSTFPDARADHLLYHLSVLHRDNTPFHNFANLRHELTTRLGRALTGTEQTELAQLRTMQGTDQFYGADVGLLTNPATAVTNFKHALQAGFRMFDAATFYRMDGGDTNSTAALAAAARECGVAAAELDVLYKVLPPDPARHIADPIADQVRGAAASLSQFPSVLVLHEVTDLEAGKADLNTLIGFVTRGESRAVGVSNVSIVYLELLYAHSVERGVPLRYVQNRFNPYQQDTEVRAFCEAHDIRYLGYSVLGSAQEGVCHDDGEGAPEQYLVPLQDPRLIALATREHLGTGEMMLSWTHQKGVSAVTHTKSGRARDNENLAASRRPLSAALMTEIDALVSTPPSMAARDFGGRVGIEALYGALRDPTAWYVMDELASVAGGLGLLEDIATAIMARNPAAAAQREALANFGHNLMRLAADLQSPANRRAQNWLAVMKEQFVGLAAAAGGAAVGDLIFEWANKNSDRGGHAQNALQDIQGIIGGTYVPDRPITDTGRANQPHAVAAPVAAVEPAVGTVLNLTAHQAPGFFHLVTYAETAFAAVAPGSFNINYLGQFNIRVRVTANLGATVTATVEAND